MAELEKQHMAVLKKLLAERFVPDLPPLIGNGQAAEQEVKQLSRAFSAFALHKLLDISPKEAAASVVDDVDDRGIDAIYYFKGDKTLYLLQSKLKARDQVNQDDMQSFCTGIRLLLNQDFDGFNANVTNRLEEIENALHDCDSIRLVIPFTGDGVSESAKKVLSQLLNDDDLQEERLERNVVYYSAAEITRDILNEQAFKPVNTTISFQKYDKIGEPRVTYYGMVYLSDLVALHELNDKALYERNIRYFLGSNRSSVNQAVQKTLKEAPQDFFYLNNGVTAVCDEVKQKGRNTKSKARRFEVRGFSIINGAQTVASAAEFSKQNPDQSIKDAKVMLTLIKAPADGAFGKRITKARNHQNPVQLSNFAALDENQERLRQEVALLGFSYHYRPEAATSSINAFSLEDAIRALSSWQRDARFYAWLKSDIKRLSNADSAEYAGLFPSTLSGIRLLNAVLCYRTISTLVTEYEQNAPAHSQEKLIYRNAVHVIAAVMLKRLGKRIAEAAVIDTEALKAVLSQPLDQLRQEALDLSQRRLTNVGPLAYFRNQGNVVEFASELMETHFSLGVDPAIATLKNVQNTEKQYPRQRLFEYLSNKAPQL
ncbi:abortive phage resistance protein [Lampropedia puyangensis]|uniref:Abortive phage resistance protein n=1 Tax=Lampropedia puyangensis TaxID=1330072 RepID=A0A4S8ES52_9BURK|nr:AIPR family protein [Lampropedia puyangensis]THT97709.1 abortive phage resistance protein [Lampropedia puyangensis]